MYRGYTNNDQMSLSSASGQFKSKPLAAEKRVTLESINWLVESGGKQVFYKKEKEKRTPFMTHLIVELVWQVSGCNPRDWTLIL